MPANLDTGYEQQPKLPRRMPYHLSPVNIRAKRNLLAATSDQATPRLRSGFQLSISEVVLVVLNEKMESTHDGEYNDR